MSQGFGSYVFRFALSASKALSCLVAPTRSALAVLVRLRTSSWSRELGGVNTNKQSNLRDGKLHHNTAIRLFRASEIHANEAQLLSALEVWGPDRQPMGCGERHGMTASAVKKLVSALRAKLTMLEGVLFRGQPSSRCW
jgi:hypothetical protein